MQSSSLYDLGHRNLMMLQLTRWKLSSPLWHPLMLQLTRRKLSSPPWHLLMLQLTQLRFLLWPPLMAPVTVLLQNQS